MLPKTFLLTKTNLKLPFLYEAHTWLDVESESTKEHTHLDFHWILKVKQVQIARNLLDFFKYLNSNKYGFKWPLNIKFRFGQNVTSILNFWTISNKLDHCAMCWNTVPLWKSYTVVCILVRIQPFSRLWRNHP